MKKLLSLLLALTMLILPCAFAESAEDAENTEATEEIEVQLVEDAIAGLRYNLPADWIVLSAAAIESMLAAGMETEEVESALSDELIAQVEALHLYLRRRNAPFLDARRPNARKSSIN